MIYNHERRRGAKYDKFFCSVFLICLLVAVSVSIYLVHVIHQYTFCRTEYSELQEVYREIQHKEEMGGVEEVDGEGDAVNDANQELYSSFKEINGDYIAWIRIPGTEISYPVVQGQDNDYYLNHSFTHTESVAGCLFIEASIPAFTADNTVVFGHNMKDLSMFGSLKKYRNEEYFKNHLNIEITTGEGKQNYRIFAIYEQDANEGYQCEFSTKKEKDKYVEAAVSTSIHKSDEVAKSEDKLITLSTCTANGNRLVIVAKKVSVPKEATNYLSKEEIDDVTHCISKMDTIQEAVPEMPEPDFW